MTDFAPDMDDLIAHNVSTDPIVIETIIRVYYAPIHRFTMSVLTDPTEAEDAVQETFIKAALNLDRYRTGTNFRAWLYTIALNTCRGMLRKRGVRQRLENILSNMPSAWMRPYPEERMIEMETCQALKTAVETLDEKHRLPILLRFVHDLSISEIAQILGIREGTVHSRLHYAIKKLRWLVG